MRRTRCSSVAILVAAALVTMIPGSRLEAQIPETFENLRILPADISKEELVNVMRSFASALKVRCSHCHVGEHATLEGFDFASDDKEKKRVARVMMRMTASINAESLPQTGRDNLIEVKCVTCHHGMARPQTLRDLMLETIESEGVAAALTSYRELRDRRYGRGIYDFGAGTLNSAGEVLASSGRLDEAIEVMRFNLEFHEDSAHSHYLLGTFLIENGEREAGIASVEKTVELDPDNGWYRDQLSSLRTSSPVVDDQVQ